MPCKRDVRLGFVLVVVADPRMLVSVTSVDAEDKAPIPGMGMGGGKSHTLNSGSICSFD